MAVPSWKLQLLERRRREEEELRRRQRDQQDRVAQLPPWKRELLERRRAKAGATSSPTSISSSPSGGSLASGLSRSSEGLELCGDEEAPLGRVSRLRSRFAPSPWPPGRSLSTEGATESPPPVATQRQPSPEGVHGCWGTTDGPGAIKGLQMVEGQAVGKAQGLATSPRGVGGPGETKGLQMVEGQELTTSPGPVGGPGATKGLEMAENSREVKGQGLATSPGPVDGALGPPKILRAVRSWGPNKCLGTAEVKGQEVATSPGPVEGQEVAGSPSRAKGQGLATSLMGVDNQEAPGATEGQGVVKGLLKSWKIVEGRGPSGDGYQATGPAEGQGSTKGSPQGSVHTVAATTPIVATASTVTTTTLVVATMTSTVTTTVPAVTSTSTVTTTTPVVATMTPLVATTTPVVTTTTPRMATSPSRSPSEGGTQEVPTPLVPSVGGSVAPLVGVVAPQVGGVVATMRGGPRHAPPPPPAHPALQRRSGNTITVRPRRAGVATATPDLVATSPPNPPEGPPKKRYPTAEEIQVIGGYLALPRSCLAKNDPHRKKLKIWFSERELERTFCYPSEGVAWGTSEEPGTPPLGTPPSPGPPDEDEEDDDPPPVRGLSGGLRARALLVDESCRR